MQRTVLVTGASGYIAKHIVLGLLNGGYRVRGSVRSAAKAAEVPAAVGPLLADKAGLDERLAFVTLDLEKDAGWGEALHGVDALLHTASPFPIVQPRDEQALIRPAVDGTLRALRAAKGAGVGRIVLTSSCAAVMYRTPESGRPILDERDWTDLADPRVTAYVKSKTLAERAAWDFVAGDGKGLDLTTINPVLVVGPALDRHIGSSLQLVQRILRARDPAVPRLGVPVVDVRDVATMHIRALERPAAIGQRFVASNEFLWLADIARTFARAFPERRVVTRPAPDMLVRLLGLFDAQVRSVVPSLGRKTLVSADRARRDLDISFRGTRESLVDTGRFLIANGLA